MKNFLIMLLVACLPCLILGSCSKNNEEDDPTPTIEGTWGLTHIEGWSIEEDGEKVTFNENCNPLAPSSAYEDKVEITKTSSDTYRLNDYYYDLDDKKWKSMGVSPAKLQGNTLIIESAEVVATMTLISVTPTKMVVEVKHSDNGYYAKAEFMKM